MYLQMSREALFFHTQEISQWLNTQTKKSYI